MKRILSFKIILTLLFTIQFASRTNGQQYHKLIEGPTKYWDVAQHDNSSICELAGTPDRYFINNDTLINSILYSKVYAFPFISIHGTGCSPFVIDTDYYQSDIYIREDTLSRKVYRYYPDINEEALLFDFSLDIDDTIDYPEEYGTLIIDSIYEVTTLDNIKRKTWTFLYEMSFYEYTEGIGGYQGPFELPVWRFPGRYDIYCVKNNSKIISSGNCYDFITSLEEEIKLNEFSVFPNPANTEVTIITGTNKSYFIEICSVSGVTLIRSDYLKDSITIDISKLISGYYIVKIFDKREDIYFKKLIKI